MFASLVVAALGALPLFTQGVAADPACIRQYTVKSGDTCNSIGAAQSASTYQILAINSANINYACTNLMPGQSICLGTEGADCTTTHVVQPGETCLGIEAMHGINSTQLYTNNPNIDENCFNIYSGEILCVASTHLVPDAPVNLFKNQTIATNQNPQPDTPYVDTSTTWEIVDPEDLQDGEDIPFCDEVGA